MARTRTTRLTLLVLLLAAGVVALLWQHRPAGESAVPASTTTESAVAVSSSRLAALLTEERLSEKKLAFLDSLLLPVMQENLHIEQERERLQYVANLYLHHQDISEDDFNWLKALADEYRMPPRQRSDIHFFYDLLARVDIVPPSLALAQAALESGWGSSRSAREDNNYFGHSCTARNCGELSTHPDDSPGTRFREFADKRQSIHHYMLNLNTHPAYKELRTLRAELRASGKVPDGLSLAPALHHYSVRGRAYSDDLQRLIRSNSLDMLD